MIELSNNLFNQTCTTKPVPQTKIKFEENLIISERYYVILGDGGDEGDRTPYLNAASVALYQMSYVPMFSNFAVQEF